MKSFIALSLFVAVASAGVLSPIQQRFPLVPVIPLEELEGRITNGELARPGQFPYQVGLSLVFGSSGAWCGGTIISEVWILTAAHCAEGADSVTVYVGATNIKDHNEQGQQRIYISGDNIVIHEHWKRSTLSNDIALIKFTAAIEFNDLVQPATLPKIDGQYSKYEGDLVWASGWGKVSDSAIALSPELRYITVPVIKNSICKMYILGLLTDKMLCTSGADKKSTCNGDSGGPLVYKDGDINYVIGVTSFGIAFGCEQKFPAVFTRVTSYLGWIEKESGVVNK